MCLIFFLTDTICKPIRFTELTHTTFEYYKLAYCDNINVGRQHCQIIAERVQQLLLLNWCFRVCQCDEIKSRLNAAWYFDDLIITARFGSAILKNADERVYMTIDCAAGHIDASDFVDVDLAFLN
jgi:hypothetical protein